MPAAGGRLVKAARLPALVLAALLALLLLHSSAAARYSREWALHAADAQQAAAAGDWAEATRALDALEASWAKAQPWLLLTASHSDIAQAEELTALARAHLALQSRSDACGALSRLQLLLERLAADQQLSLRNIL